MQWSVATKRVGRSLREWAEEEQPESASSAHLPICPFAHLAAKRSAVAGTRLPGAQHAFILQLYS